eukprot:10925069-Ditylum_brightwellii.AAC.1
MLDDADYNNICCLIPHGNSAGTEGALLLDDVDGSVGGGESRLTHLTQVVDCHVKQNMCGPNATKSRSVLYDNAISNKGKEVD